MTGKTENNGLPSLNLPEASSSALRGRQSVRATFKLSKSCIRAITIVSTHLGIKQKSLFDHLIEDTEALRSIARSGQDQAMAAKPVVTKTFVISRNSMNALDRMSDEFGITREVLIERSVQRLMPIIATEQETHEERKRVMSQIRAHLEQGKKIQREIEKTFGQNDIISEKYDQIIVHYRQCTDEIQKYIDKSRNIESFDLGSL